VYDMTIVYTNLLHTQISVPLVKSARYLPVLPLPASASLRAVLRTLCQHITALIYQSATTGRQPAASFLFACTITAYRACWLSGSAYLRSRRRRRRHSAAVLSFCHAGKLYAARWQGMRWLHSNAGLGSAAEELVRRKQAYCPP
jgi:hypothetical protein